MHQRQQPVLTIHLCWGLYKAFHRVEVEQRWSWRYRDVLTYLDAADVEAGTEGGSHDDAWRTASGDLLHRFPIVGALDRLQDLWQETDTVTGLNGHFKSS